MFFERLLVIQIHPQGPLFAVELGNELAGGHGWTGNETTIGDDYAQLRSHMDRIFGGALLSPCFSLS
jgi:hypothetical protein